MGKLQSAAFDGGFAQALTATCTYASALTAGSTLVAFATCGTNSPITITDSASHTWSQINLRYYATVDYTISLHWAPNTGTATPTVTATYNGTNKLFRSMVIAEFSAIASSPVDVSTAGNDNTATTTTPTDVSMTTTVDGDLILSGIGSDGGTVSAGSGFTLMEPMGASNTALEWQIQTTAGAITPNFSQTPAVRAVVLSAALKASGGGGAAASSPRPFIFNRAAMVRASRW